MKFGHNGQSRLTHNQICAVADLPAFEALAPFFPMMPPHEQAVFIEAGECYRQTGELPGARSGDWARERLEFYRAKAAKSKGIITSVREGSKL